MDKNKLDFIVVGTAKSGTTSLHELIKNHPDIAVPKAKEVPYFNDPLLQKKGINWYLKQHFKGRSKNIKWGTVTPQYTYYKNDFSPKDTARLIKKHNPKIKIVVILRHPVARTFSHFKTSVRRSNEKRSFYQAVNDLISNPENLNLQRHSNWDPTNIFLLGSEYGNILKDYYKVFGKRNILLLNFEELKDHPDIVLNRLFKFIGIDDRYQPDNLNNRYNAGGMKPKIGLLTPKYLHNIPGLRNIWRTLVPYKLRKIVEVNVNSWNAKVDNEKLDKSSKAYKMLCKHFSSDLAILEKISNKKFPWNDIKKIHND